MPRSLQQILEQADQLSKRFETHGAQPGEPRDATALRAIGEASRARAQSEAAVAQAVAQARSEEHSWASIGAMLGTSGEAARQRYG